MSFPVIQKVDPEDYETLKEIAVLEKAAFGQDGLSAFNLSLLARSSGLFVLRDEGKIAAEALVTYRPADAVKSALLFGLAVAGDCRRKGYGLALMNAIISRLIDEGVAELDLTVDPENTPAINIYCEKLGFKRIKTDLAHPETGRSRLLLRKNLL